MSLDAGRGIPAYAGMTGGCGNGGMGGREWGNAKAQGRNEKQAGYDGMAAGYDVMGFRGGGNSQRQVEMPRHSSLHSKSLDRVERGRAVMSNDRNSDVHGAAASQSALFVQEWVDCDRSPVVRVPCGR